MQQITAPYVFTRRQRGIFAEIYFPKRVVYQRAIFRALNSGLHEDRVKRYFRRHINSLLLELADYPNLFDPRQYERERTVQRRRIRPSEALERIEMYRTYFKGWSMYEVDGMFLNEETNMLNEERTQVIRILFRPPTAFLLEASQRRCYDVHKAITDWVIADPRRLDGQRAWSRQEKSRFVASLEPWPRQKREFVQEYFEPIAKEVSKWVDDCALFGFGYLVRNFWNEVLATGRREDEIWITSFFNLNINIVQRIETQIG